MSHQKTCDHCPKFVQIFRSHRRFNRFVLAAVEDGFSVCRVQLERRWIRPRITAHFTKTHERNDAGHCCDCCCHCEC